MQGRSSSHSRLRFSVDHADSAAVRALALVVLFASDDAIHYTLSALADLGDDEARGLLAAMLPDDDYEGA
jgi:hypothetical protein